MVVRLRPHHLLCILTYVGKGYSSAFVANFSAVLARIASGESIVLIQGPDDICAPLLHEESEAHCLSERISSRDREAFSDLAMIPVIPRALGEDSFFVLDRQMFSGLQREFKTGNLRTACAGCEWKPLCDRVAELNFQEAFLENV